MTTPPAHARRIVVGVDASRGSSSAVRLAARLAADLDAQVIVVHANRSSPEGPPSNTDLRRWESPLVEAGVVAVRTVVENDDAVRLLFRIAEEEDAYLIVVGPTRRGELREFVLGSVAMELVHHGRRPIVIAPTEHSEINPF